MSTLLALLLAQTVAPTLSAVEPEPRNTTYGPNLIVVNPADLFSGAITAEYERALTPRLGLTAALCVWSVRGLFTPDTAPSFIAISPELGVRFHFLRGAPAGLWIGPAVSMGAVLAREEGPVTRAWSWGANVSAGYNFIIGHHFTVQMGAGFGFIDSGEQLAWMPRARLGLGYAF